METIPDHLRPFVAISLFLMITGIVALFIKIVVSLNKEAEAEDRKVVRPMRLEGIQASYWHNCENCGELEHGSGAVPLASLSVKELENGESVSDGGPCPDCSGKTTVHMVLWFDNEPSNYEIDP